MEKEIKKITKRNTKKTPKVIETVEAIIDDVIEEEIVEVEETKPRKTLKELRNEFRKKKYDLEVEILNLNSCATSCRSRDGRIIFDFQRSGDREFITLDDALEIASRYKGFFEKHLIAIIDVDCNEDEYDLEDIINYLNLGEIYQDNGIENYDTDYIGQILKMDTKKFKRFIEDADMDLVKSVTNRAVELFRKGKFDSRIKEEILSSRLGREDLFEM